MTITGALALFAALWARVLQKMDLESSKYPKRESSEEGPKGSFQARGLPVLGPEVVVSTTGGSLVLPLAEELSLPENSPLPENAPLPGNPPLAV